MLPIPRGSSRAVQTHWTHCCDGPELLRDRPEWIGRVRRHLATCRCCERRAMIMFTFSLYAPLSRSDYAG